MSIQILKEDDLSYSKAVRVFLWIAQIVAAVIFFAAGVQKFIGHHEMVRTFETIGIGQWFRYFTGAVEVLAAGLLLTRYYSGLGALLLVPTMIGAVLMHLFVIGGSPMIPIVLVTLVAVIAMGRQEQIVKFFRRN